MFCKGSITSYDYNAQKGTIFLTEINNEVEFLAEDLAPMMVDPKIGDGVSCFVIEQNAMKQAKFITRLEHQKADTENVKNDFIDGNGIDLNLQKKEKLLDTAKIDLGSLLETEQDKRIVKHKNDKLSDKKSASKPNLYFQQRMSSELVSENLKDDSLSFDLSSIDLEVKKSNKALDPILLDGLNNKKNHGFECSLNKTDFELGDPLIVVENHTKVDIHKNILDNAQGITALEADDKSGSVFMKQNEIADVSSNIDSNNIVHSESRGITNSIEKNNDKFINNQKYESRQQEFIGQQKNDSQLIQSESTLGKVKTSLFYKKINLQQFKKLKKENKQLNRSVFLIVIVVLATAILLTFCYQKMQAYQLEQNVKAQVYLIEHQRIIEEQRSQLGELPDKILTDETLDELLGKDRADFSNITVNQPNNLESSSTDKTSQQLIAMAQYSCDGRVHCSQMKSYREAVFFQKNCPNTQMDGDGDGEPCERQFGR